MLAQLSPPFKRLKRRTISSPTSPHYPLPSSLSFHRARLLLPFYNLKTCSSPLVYFHLPRWLYSEPTCSTGMGGAVHVAMGESIIRSTFATDFFLADVEWRSVGGVACGGCSGKESFLPVPSALCASMHPYPSMLHGNRPLLRINVARARGRSNDENWIELGCIQRGLKDVSMWAAAACFGRVFIGK